MLDTIEKRASSLSGIGGPFRFVLPWPSGSIDVEQRAHLSGTYAFDFLPPTPVEPDVACFDFIIDGVSADIVIDGVSAYLHVMECDD